MVTKITDVAKKVGVAPSTVSNALTGKKFVSKELKKKIIQICEELDYHPNFYASALQTSKTNIIGLLLEENSAFDYHNFYTDLIISCLVETSKSGYNLLIYYESDESKFLQALRQGRAPIDGAIILAPTLTDKRIAQMENNRIPCVVIGRPEKSLNLNYVDVNNQQLTQHITKILFEEGYQKVFLINSTKKLTISKDRFEGFKEAYSDLDIPFFDNLCIYTNKSSMEEGYEFAACHLDTNIAFITANEVLAKGVCKAISDSTYQLGKDVGVFALGFGENEAFLPKVSHAKQDYREIGHLAVSTLIRLIDHIEVKEDVLVESQLIRKESSTK